jgi:hypothetical protein
MDTVHIVGFARVAVRLTQVAIRFTEVARRLRALRAPLGRGDAEALLESAGKRAGRAEAVVDRDLEDVGVSAEHELTGGGLEACSLDELLHVLANYRLEQTVKMEWRERGDLRQGLEREVFRPVLPDVVEHAIHALLVFQSMPVGDHGWVDAKSELAIREPIPRRA